MTVVSFVVKMFLHTKKGTQRVTTLPCVSFRDAEILAGSVRGQDRSAEIGISVPLSHGLATYIPCTSRCLDAVRQACDEAMDAMTRPALENINAPTSSFFKPEDERKDKDEIPY